MSTSYLPPLDQLLALGEPEFGHRKEWLDYLAMGFTAGHVPELMRMVQDDAFDVEAGPARFAYLHAWRTLGLLRAEAAIDLLLAFMPLDNDWVLEELPVVLGMIGPAAIDPLGSALGRWSLAPEPWAAGVAANALVEVAQRFPETRSVVVEILARQLRWWGRHDPTLNTMLIHDLVELQAVETAPIMEAAFAADRVDTDYDDDWEDVQVALGLLPARITPKPAYARPLRLRPTPIRRASAPKPAADHKARRKAEKAARQRNRRRR